MFSHIPLTNRQTKILALLNEATNPVSLTKVCRKIFGDTNPFNVVRTEYLLDEMWELGFVVNLGEFQKYRWIRNEKGTKLRDYLIILLGDH